MSNPQAAARTNEQSTAGAGAGINPVPGPPAEALKGLSEDPRETKRVPYITEKFFVFLKTKIKWQFNHSITH